MLGRTVDRILSLVLMFVHFNFCSSFTLRDEKEPRKVVTRVLRIAAIRVLPHGSRSELQEEAQPAVFSASKTALARSGQSRRGRQARLLRCDQLQSQLRSWLHSWLQTWLHQV